MRIIEPITITDTILTDTNVPEDDFAVWAVGTAYVAGNKVILTSTHRIYEAVQATTGDDPATDDGTNWLDIGATNRYRAFDGSIEGQTVQATSIEYEFTVAGNFGGLALLNIVGADVTVNITDPVDGALPEIDVSLSDTSGVLDWFTYFIRL
jgi:Carbohydrate binding domain.